MKDLTGQRFEKLTVVVFHSREGKSYIWKCLCDCGKVCLKNGNHLRSGSAKSCGCLKRGAKTKHGLIRLSEYKAWQNMKARCLNPNDISFKNYGERGIKVCDRWKNSFSNFLSDMGRKTSDQHSLDRINVNGNYEPSNCRWATDIEQNNNTRRNKKLIVQTI